MPKKSASLWIVLKYSANSDVLSRFMAALLKSESQLSQFNQHVLADFNVVMADVTGLWNHLAILEISLSHFKEEDDIECSFGRYEQKILSSEISYEFELVVFNQAGALSSVLTFFTNHARILECASKQFTARYTNETMQIIKLIVSINGIESISYLRDQFSDFCDEHNFDAVLEPIKY
ncbi:hypothetical protein AwWohl_11800 [Gammaproteobacteria bacterium]|nr:hypothetical protein AwWohl_11800 [Gammaproteobacteria bacterium]